MIDFHAAQIRGHRQNIERYCRLLATELTDLERRYLHKRIAEEHAQLERIKKIGEEQQPEVRLKGGTGEYCDMSMS
jgi:5-bromo-4-chloroindolyl phosphate hydrolysis protein